MSNTVHISLLLISFLFIEGNWLKGKPPLFFIHSKLSSARQASGANSSLFWSIRNQSKATGMSYPAVVINSVHGVSILRYARLWNWRYISLCVDLQTVPVPFLVDISQSSARKPFSTTESYPVPDKVINTDAAFRSSLFSVHHFCHGTVFLNTQNCTWTWSIFYQYVTWKYFLEHGFNGCSFNIWVSSWKGLSSIGSLLNLLKDEIWSCDQILSYTPLL